MNTPESRPRFLSVTKRLAARCQLETAIALCFSHGDLISIHTLAAAANECYHAIGKQKHVGKPSRFQTWINSQPQAYRIRLRDAQNFFKHERNLKQILSYNPLHGEVLMFDSIMCHNALYRSPTSLMVAFMLMFTRRDPQARILGKSSFPYTAPIDAMEDLEKAVERSEFFKVIAPLLTPKKPYKS